MSKKPPAKVNNCSTHHEACPCREYRYEQMAQALRIIRTWALCDDSNKTMRSVAMTDIAHKAAEGLGE